MKALTATPDSSSADTENRPPTEATANTSTSAPVAPAEDMARQRQGKGGLRSGGDGDDRSQRAARGHADDARVGHRVADQALHHRPGNAEGRPDGQCQGDAGQPDGGHYRLLGIRGGGLPDANLLQQDVGGVGKGDGVGAKGGGDDDKDDSCCEERYSSPGQSQQHRGTAQRGVAAEPARVEPHQQSGSK